MTVKELDRQLEPIISNNTNIANSVSNIMGSLSDDEFTEFVTTLSQKIDIVTSIYKDYFNRLDTDTVNDILTTLVSYDVVVNDIKSVKDLSKFVASSLPSDVSYNQNDINYVYKKLVNAGELKSIIDNAIRVTTMCSYMSSEDSKKFTKISSGKRSLFTSVFKYDSLKKLDLDSSKTVTNLTVVGVFNDRMDVSNTLLHIVKSINSHAMNVCPRDVAKTLSSQVEEIVRYSYLIGFLCGVWVNLESDLDLILKSSISLDDEDLITDEELIKSVEEYLRFAISPENFTISNVLNRLSIHGLVAMETVTMEDKDLSTSESLNNGSNNLSQNENTIKGAPMEKNVTIKFDIKNLAEIANVDVETLQVIYDEAENGKGEEAVANFVKDQVEMRKPTITITQDKTLWEKYKDLPLWQQILIGCGVVGAVAGAGYLIYRTFAGSKEEEEWETVTMLNQ